MRPPFYGPGSIRRRKRFSNSHIRKSSKNCHKRTTPQPATVLKKKHRRGSPVTLLNTSGTRPTVCSPGSPSAAPATFPADNCGGQVRLTIAQPVPMQETAGCGQNTQTNFLAAGSGNPSAHAPNLPKCPENDTFRPLYPLASGCDRPAATPAHHPREHPAQPRPFAVAAGKSTNGLVAFLRWIAEDPRQRSGSSHDCTS